jgi:hypothetical protein
MLQVITTKGSPQVLTCPQHQQQAHRQQMLCQAQSQMSCLTRLPPLLLLPPVVAVVCDSWL